MEIDGIPIYVFAPLLVAAGLALWLVRQLVVLGRRLGVDPKAVGDKRMAQALYGDERRLRDLGVHRTVWNIRLAFVGETFCILLFTYLIYRAMGLD